ncbi:MAG: glycosyltransferase [Verrucomicrobiae bacterium]|nr:glycosyltransferase [Verrucomicrobiae bacterium]
MKIYFVLSKINTIRVNCGVEALHTEAQRQGHPHEVLTGPDPRVLAAEPGLVIINFKHYFKNRTAFSPWLRRLRKAGFVTANYHIDAPYNNGLKTWAWWLLRHGDWPFDLFFTHSVEADAPASSRTVYLPNACGLELIDTTVETPRYDVGFCGNFSATNPEHRKRVELLQTLERMFQSRGISCILRQDDTTMETWLRHGRECFLQLSAGSTADLPHQMSHGMPARIYGFSCIGALTLIEPRHHLRDDFPAPFDLPTYRTPEECVETVTALLRDREATLQRRRRLMEFARARHQYSHRLATLLQNAARIGTQTE